MPRIFLWRLIKRNLSWWDKKRVPGGQLKDMFIDMQFSTPFQNKMDQLIGTELGSVTVTGTARLIARAVKCQIWIWLYCSECCVSLYSLIGPFYRKKLVFSIFWIWNAIGNHADIVLNITKGAEDIKGRRWSVEGEETAFPSWASQRASQRPQRAVIF